jgi:hypothetical protein
MLDAVVSVVLDVVSPDGLSKVLALVPFVTLGFSPPVTMEGCVIVVGVLSVLTSEGSSVGVEGD